jgi:hypothetical protein
MDDTERLLPKSNNLSADDYGSNDKPLLTDTYDMKFHD